jgi:hypothetical protein
MRAFDIAEIAKGLFAGTEQLPDSVPPGAAIAASRPMGIRERICGRQNRVHNGRQRLRSFATW